MNDYAKSQLAHRDKRIADCTQEQIQTAVDSGFKRADVLVRGIAQDLSEQALGDIRNLACIRIDADVPDMSLPFTDRLNELGDYE